jgi:hypothetical protein
LPAQLFHTRPNRREIIGSLPDEVHGPIGDAVIEVLIERGLAKQRFSVPIPD